jgi:hypothetical protein
VRTLLPTPVCPRKVTVVVDVGEIIFVKNAPNSCKPESRPPEKLVAWFEETAKHKPLQIIPPKPDYFRCSVFSEETESAWRTSQ